MGVPGEQDPALAVGADLGGDACIQLFGPREAQRTVDEVVLLVDDEEITVHFSSSCAVFFKIPNTRKKVNRR